MSFALIKKIKQIFFKKNSFFWEFSFFLSLVFLFFKYWRKQLFINYIDYGDGCIIYEANLFKNGLIIYKDFFAPQPPIIYLVGAFILKIFNNPLIIKYFLFFLFLSGNIIAFYIISRFLNNKIISFFTVIFANIFFNNIYWWPTFTGESFLRFFILLMLLYLLPIEKINKNKLIFFSFFLNLIFFTKFTSVFFILFMSCFLFFFNQKFFLIFLKYFFMFFLLFLFIFLFFFGDNFLFQTVLLRSLLSFKKIKTSLLSTIYFSIKSFPFFSLNSIIGFFFFKKKKYSKSLLSFIYPFWFPNLIFNFFEGTYLYIFYPVEIFILLGFFYVIFYFNKIKINLFLKTLISFFSFWITLIFIYQFQVLKANYFLATNKFDIDTTKKVIELIKKKSKRDEEIISPPFFAVFSNRRVFNNFHDPFFLYYYLIKKNKSNLRLDLFDNAIATLKKERPNLVIVDWRIKKILNILDTNYFLSYKKIEEVNFLNNKNESLEIYIKKND